VAGDDLVIIADQDGICEAEFWMLSAICRIGFLEWVRAFRLYGRSPAIGIAATAIDSMGVSWLRGKPLPPGRVGRDSLERTLCISCVANARRFGTNTLFGHVQRSP
jgi:hypothetical protein